jgi:nitrate/nitrite transporter NarK
VLPLLGGFFLDQVGPRTACIVFSALALAGTVLVWAGGEYSSFSAMVVGRLVFGCGAESLIVAQAAVLTVWFGGHELSFAFSAATAAGRFGSLFTLLVSPRVASRYHYTDALLLALAVMAASMAACLAFVWLGRHAEAVLRRPVTPPQDPSVPASRLRDLLSFPRMYWLILLIGGIYYAVTMTQDAMMTALLETQWVFSSTKAGAYASLPVLITILLSPVLGAVLDTLGYLTEASITGHALLVPAFLLFAFSSGEAYWPLALYGAAASVIPTVVWSAVPFVIEFHRLGLAYGAMTCAQNFFVALSFITAAAIRDGGRFRGVECMLAGIALSAVGLCCAWRAMDKAGAGILSGPWLHRADGMAPIASAARDDAQAEIENERLLGEGQ